MRRLFLNWQLHRSIEIHPKQEAFAIPRIVVNFDVLYISSTGIHSLSHDRDISNNAPEKSCLPLLVVLYLVRLTLGMAPTVVIWDSEKKKKIKKWFSKKYYRQRWDYSVLFFYCYSASVAYEIGGHNDWQCTAAPATIIGSIISSGFSSSSSHHNNNKYW